MTHATKAIGLLLIKDYVRVRSPHCGARARRRAASYARPCRRPSNLSVDDMLYDDQDLVRAFDRTIAVDFHQEIELEGIKFSCHHAGHVLGGAMFNVQIAGVKVLYTGDYSREEDRHLPSAELPATRPDILICESTFGKQSHEPMLSREARFTRTAGGRGRRRARGASDAGGLNPPARRPDPRHRGARREVPAPCVCLGRARAAADHRCAPDA